MVCIDNFFDTLLKKDIRLKRRFGGNMLAKMPQKTVKSPFRNKLTIISLVLLMGLGVSAAYFTVPFLQSPIPAPNNLIGNTTNNTVATPVSHTNTSLEIQTPQVNATSTNTSTVSTSKNNQVNNTSNQGTNTSKQGSNTSKTTNKSKTSTNSQTNTQTTSSSTKKTTNNTG